MSYGLDPAATLQEQIAIVVQAGRRTMGLRQRAALIGELLRWPDRGKLPWSEQNVIRDLENAHRSALIAAYAFARGWKQSAAFDLPTLALGRKHNAGYPDYTVFELMQDTFKHPIYWKKDGRAVAITTQPYDMLDPEPRAAFVAWGAERGLKVSFPTDVPSWWFPGFTTLAEITRHPCMLKADARNPGGERASRTAYQQTLKRLAARDDPDEPWSPELNFDPGLDDA
jgi:hypothetical protein